MLLALGAGLVALGCVIASGRRLAWAVAPVELEPRMLLKALEGDRALDVWTALKGTLASDERFAWEQELLAAFDEVEGPKRDARVNEQLLELEGRAARWARVPRVCASIGTSVGLLFGSLGLLQGLAEPADGTGDAIHEALFSALGSLSLGIAATAFCVAVHVRAGRVSAERRAAIDALVDRLERLRSDGRGGRPADPGPEALNPGRPAGHGGDVG